MKRRRLKRLMSAVLLILTISTFAVGEAAEQDATTDPVVEFGFNEKINAFLQMDECIVRSRYLIEVPDGAEVHEAIAEAYGGYQEIHLIEYGYYEIMPVLQGYYVCVGIREDGAMEILPAPLDLVRKMYDFSMFDGMILAYPPALTE